MTPDRHDIPIIGDFYTKAEVDAMVAEAVEEAKRIDEASMAEHNFKATIISMILGFICLALFLDGTLRLLGYPDSSDSTVFKVIYSAIKA